MAPGLWLWRVDYPDWTPTFGIEDVLRDIHDHNVDRWTAEAAAR